MAGDALIKLDLAFDDGTAPLARPLARHPSESQRGFALRLAALLLAWNGRIEVREGVCRGDEPALSDPGPPRVWFDLVRADDARRRRALSAADLHVLVVDAAARHRDAAPFTGRLAERARTWRVDARALEDALANTRRLRGVVERSADSVVVSSTAPGSDLRVVVRVERDQSDRRLGSRRDRRRD